MSRFWQIFILFFVSGACGLIYQVVWARVIAVLFGRSVLAVGVVLAAFMAGLALGSYFLGKFSDKNTNPLRLYAIYEIGIGSTALLSTYLLFNVAPLYVGLYGALGGIEPLLTVFRFMVAFLLVLVPTTLMGATLPILSRVVIREMDRVGRELGKLYAINTLGAVAGTIAAGFFLIGHLGLYGAVFVAVAGNLGVGAFAWALSGSQRRFAPENSRLAAEERTPPPLVDLTPGKTSALLLFAFALSGLASFAYEMFWTRSLVFILGNTTYAFSLMLTAFLSGIASGGYLIRFVADRSGDRIRLFALLEILIGIFSASSLPLLFYLLESDYIESFIFRSSGRLGSLVFAEAIIALIIMLIPATLIGATLPLVGKIFVADLRATGATVGKVYAVNTIGNVAGALLPGLLILPLLGIQKGILLMALLNISLGCMLLVVRRENALKLCFGCGLLFFILAGLLNEMPISFRFPAATQTIKDIELFYEEGGLVTTEVWKVANSGNKIMSVDGINIGGTNDVDYKQQILAHLPKLFLKNYKSELSIGLGSGILIGESGRHQQLERLVCVEIAPSVVTGSEFFKKENYRILEDPRVELVVDDIAHFLQTTSEQFDIISSDGKTDEKYSTNAFSYSLDYYNLLKKHLTPGGLVIQWIPTALPSSQYNLVLRTFLASFPYATHWYFPPVGRFFMSNTFLVGSNQPISIDPLYMNSELDTNRESFHGIRKYGLNRAEDILSRFIADRGTLLENTPPGPINSVANPYYEFYSPTDYALQLNDRILENHLFFLAMLGQDFNDILVDKSVGFDGEKLLLNFEAERIFLQGHESQLKNESYRKVLNIYGQAIDLAPDSHVLREQVVAYLNEQFRVFFHKADYQNALAFLRLAAEIHPNDAEVHEDYGMMLRFTGQDGAAIQQFKRALELDTSLVFARRELGSIYGLQGETEKALEHWREVLDLDPYEIGTLVSIGVHLAQEGAFAEGTAYLSRAYRLAPENPEVIHGYGLAKFLAGDYAAAREIVLDGDDYYKGNPSFESLRKQILEITL